MRITRKFQSSGYYMESSHSKILDVGRLSDTLLVHVLDNVLIFLRLMVLMVRNATSRGATPVTPPYFNTLFN